MDSTTYSMEIDTEQNLVIAGGEIDYTVSQEFRSRLRKFIDSSAGDVKLDFTQLEYLDSSGLAVVIEARRLLNEKSRSLTIQSISPQVKKVFTLTQVDTLFGL